MADKNSKTPRAKVAPVKIGEYEIQGLMDHEGNFFVAASQVAEFFDFAQDHASRTLERLLHKDSDFARPKGASAVNPLPVKNFKPFKLHTEIAQRPVTVITVEALSLVTKRLARKGHEKAVAIDDAMAFNSWVEVFCDAFEVETTKAERSQRIADRLSGIVTRRTLTDAMKDHGFTKNHQFGQITNLGYFRSLKTTAKNALKARNLPESANLRDHLTSRELRRVELVEEELIERIDSPPNGKSYSGYSEFYHHIKVWAENRPA